MKRVQNLRELGIAIRAARRDAGLTQEQLCKKASVSRRWLIALENGETSSPDTSKIFDTLRALNLVFGIDSPQEKTPANQATQYALNALADFDD